MPPDGWLRIILMVVAGILAVSLGGCVGTESQPLPPREALSRWDFTGFNGEIDRHLDDIGWIHIVATIGTDVNSQDVHLEVDWSFAQGHDRPQASLNYLGIPLRGPSGGTPSEAGGCVFPPGELRCGKSPAWPTGFATEHLRRFSDLANQYNITRPTVNFLYVMVNHSAAGGARLHGSWNHTAVNWTSGGPQDSFMFYVRDFDGALPSPGQETTEDLTLHMNFPVDREMLGFGFGALREGLTSGPVGEEPDPYYVPPNGTHNVVGGSYLTDYSSEHGNWTFVIPKGVTFTQEGLNQPILWGARFNLADVP